MTKEKLEKLKAYKRLLYTLSFSEIAQLTTAIENGEKTGYATYDQFQMLF